MKIDHTQGLERATRTSLSPIRELIENPFGLAGLLLVDGPIERRVRFPNFVAPEIMRIRETEKTGQPKGVNKVVFGHSGKVEDSVCKPSD